MGPGGTTPAECIPCKIGTFKDATTSTCQSCADGLITLDTGKTSSSDCKRKYLIENYCFSVEKMHKK
jgi:hypothetical protein